MSFTNLLPSQVRHYETNMGNIDVNIDFFNRAMILCLTPYSDTQLIDAVWVAGIMLRNAFKLLPIAEQDTIINLDTPASICFVNGVNGDEWNHGLYK